MVQLQPLTLALALTVSLLLAPAPTPAAGPTPAPTPAPSPQRPGGLDPAGFTTRVDNTWFPLPPGARWTYLADGPDGQVRTVVTVEGAGPAVAGVATVAVRTRSADAGGGAIRDAVSWYAQDADGNVWSFGESARDYVDGTRTGGDGWQAGVGGAQPGIVMPARPVPGLRWCGGHSPGLAEDTARVLAVDRRVDVPAGSYPRVVELEVTSPLLAGVRLHRAYAPGVGLVRSRTPGAAEHTSLIAYAKP